MIIDSCSFYILPWSTIIGNMNPIQLKATYSLLQCDHCNFICSAPEWSHHGKTKPYDVFNTLDIMHNEFFLQDLTTASMLQLNF